MGRSLSLRTEFDEVSPSRLEAATSLGANARLGAQDANVTREEWLRDAAERLARMEMRAEFDKEPCACFRCEAQGLVVQRHGLPPLHRSRAAVRRPNAPLLVKHLGLSDVLRPLHPGAAEGAD